MELELATTEDIIRELQQRRLRFALVGVENSNRPGPLKMFSAMSGLTADEALGLTRLLQHIVEENGER